MRPGRLIAAGLVAALLVLAAAIGGSYLLYARLIGQRDRVWCPTLELALSGRPPHPTPRQARAYADLREVQVSFGCERKSGPAR